VTDLPDPDSPTRPSDSPGAISSESCCTAAADAPEKRTESCRSASSGVPGAESGCVEGETAEGIHDDLNNAVLSTP
jgi:hypothetical protein